MPPPVTRAGGFASTVKLLLEDTFVGTVDVIHAEGEEGEALVPCLRVDLHEADTFLLEVQHLPDDGLEPILEDSATA